MLLKVENLHVIYETWTHALNNISFEVNEGEFLGIIGSSGSGKSTLLRCINRLREPTSGKIEFLGADITHATGEDLRKARRQIGTVFQQFNLIPRKSVLKNVIVGMLGSLRTVESVLEKFSDAVYEEAYRCIKAVGLEEKAMVRVDTLSGGQQQRVAIARSLMQNPKLLIADEPVASLDPVNSISIMHLLEKINRERGTAILCNLHVLDLVRKFATRVIALKNGEIVYEGSPYHIDTAGYKKIYGAELTAAFS